MKRIVTHARRVRRGSSLVATMWVVIALTAVVLVLARSISVEGAAAAHRVAQAKADAAELGAEQWVLAMATNELTTPGTIENISLNGGMEARQIGECFVWIIRPNPDDETLPSYGLTDEAGKIDLNTASYDQDFSLLPNIANIDDCAAAIVDWRDADGDPTGIDDAEDTYYMSLETPYHCKNAPFETTDELLLIKGITPDILYGADLNKNGILEPQEQALSNAGNVYLSSARGILPFVTAYGVHASNNMTPPTTDTATGTTTTITTDPNAPVDVNGQQAQQLVSQALQQYLTPQRAQAIMAAIQAASGQQGGGGGAGGAGGGAQAQQKTYGSLLEWAIAGQLTSAEYTTIYPYLIANPRSTTDPTTGTTTISNVWAKINVNTAGMAALMCIPNFDETDAQAIIDVRASAPSASDPSLRPDIGWILDIPSVRTKLAQPVTFSLNGQNIQPAPTVAGFITGTSYVYSAEIVTVTADGRGFKRAKVVVDASSGTPLIVYRRDLTDLGWPLDPSIRKSLREGLGPIAQETGTMTQQPGMQPAAGQ